MVHNVGINGFGRVGRGLFRVNEADRQFNVVAIKDVIPIENAAYLLKYDSNYGELAQDVRVDGDDLVVDGRPIRYFRAPDAKDIPWADLGVETLVESSGKMNRADSRSLLEQGIARIVFTRGLDDADATIVYGFNHDACDGTQRIISAGTCTGNAIVPVASLLHERYGIESGHLVTIHPVLSDQKLVDDAHTKFSLGRNASASIIPTSTNVANSLYALVPELEGRLDAISYRVPTTVVSVIDAHLRLTNPTTVEELNGVFEDASTGKYAGVLLCDGGFLGNPKVSVDYLQTPFAVVVSALDTQANGKNVSLSLFHDNEWGYCCQAYRLINHLGTIGSR